MIMDQAGVGSLAVLDDGRLVGIVTDRDLVRRGLARDLAPTAPVEKVMSTPVVTIGAEADLHSAFKLFRTHAVRRLAVVDFDDFVGMITVDDLLVDLAADLFDLARPIAAEVFTGSSLNGTWSAPQLRAKISTQPRLLSWAPATW
jgi:signal-transduction protein with cAMP-binding, CBS, and nucleotidyltransferase domain